MATKAKPISTLIVTTSAIGPTTSDTFQIIAYQIEGISVNQLLNTTADTDANLTWAGPGNAYVEHTIILSGWLLGGATSLIGFANLGDSDTGVDVDINLTTSHGLKGNLVLETIRYRVKAAAPAVPISFRGKISGAFTED